MKYPFLLAAGFAFFSMSSLATDAGMFPNVTHGKMSYAAYQAAYENQGNSREFPKLLVFSPAGKCVGVTDGKALGADKITAFIADSLRNDHKACEVVISNKFGVSKLGKDAGTGKPEITLLVTDGAPLCTACSEFKQTLLRDSHGPLASMHLDILAVSPDQQR